MKATAQAPANIAFIKYWGRTNAVLRLPANASISMNLSACTTTTTVEFASEYAKDTVELLGENGLRENEAERITKHLDLLRKQVGSALHAHVVTKNTFPKSTGIASSASGFAALTVAAVAALGMKCSEKELTALARPGSGSASRSIPDGFVKWGGEYAHSLYPASYWDIRDVVVVVGTIGKDVSSSAGHDTASTSPYFAQRLRDVPGRIARVEHAFQAKDFVLLGEVIEEDCLDMHHVMQTQAPPLYYWNETTIRLMDAVKHWRNEGLPVYFTIDAGPNVHLICEGAYESTVLEKLKNVSGIETVIQNRVSDGTKIISDHLF